MLEDLHRLVRHPKIEGTIADSFEQLVYNLDFDGENVTSETVTILKAEFKERYE